MLDFGVIVESTGSIGDRVRIEPHEFYGLDPLDAAKRYLKKIGPIHKSALFSDIVAAIHSGGGDLGNEDKLRLSLSRSTFDVAKIGEDRYGLLEFFPHVKRGTPGRKRKVEVGDSMAGGASTESEVSEADSDETEFQGPPPD